MPKHSRQRCVSLLTDQRGAAALMVMIVILAVSVIIVSSTAFRGVDDLEVGFSEEAGSHAILAAESCADEAMLRLTRDSSYAGETLVVGESTCTITVTGTPCGDCTIAVESVREAFTRRLEADVTVAGSDVSITRWEEVD